MPHERGRAPVAEAGASATPIDLEPRVRLVAERILLHLMVEDVVGHLRAGFVARIELEPEVDAAPDAAVAFFDGERLEAIEGLRICGFGLGRRRRNGFVLVPCRGEFLASVPNTLASICAAPAPMQVMLLECPGYGGVLINGTQVVAPGLIPGLVSGLLSSLALLIAVSGRHKR